ncbi:hypothetical protein DAI22_02g354100 [Oryza sativa Japonica Group]|nr:hypothetical protein DAI22_02g354100 [Oryza sativa Japonica Group]
MQTLDLQWVHEHKYNSSRDPKPEIAKGREGTFS